MQVVILLFLMQLPPLQLYFFDYSLSCTRFTRLHLTEKDRLPVISLLERAPSVSGRGVLVVVLREAMQQCNGHRSNFERKDEMEEAEKAFK